MSGWMLGPMALESMLIQVKTVASTCMVFCRLHTIKTGHRKLDVSHLILKKTVFKEYSQECGCSRTGLIFQGHIIQCLKDFFAA